MCETAFPLHKTISPCTLVQCCLNDAGSWTIPLTHTDVASLVEFLQQFVSCSSFQDLQSLVSPVWLTLFTYFCKPYTTGITANKTANKVKGFNRWNGSWELKTGLVFVRGRTFNRILHSITLLNILVNLSFRCRILQHRNQFGGDLHVN